MSFLRIAILCSAVMTAEGFSVGHVLDLCSWLAGSEKTKFDFSPDLHEEVGEVQPAIDYHVGLKQAGEKLLCRGQPEVIGSEIECSGQGERISSEMEDIGRVVVATKIEDIHVVANDSNAKPMHGLETLILLVVFVALAAMSAFACGATTDKQRPRGSESGMSCTDKTNHLMPKESETGVSCPGTTSDQIKIENATGASRVVRPHDLEPSDSETCQHCHLEWMIKCQRQAKVARVVPCHMEVKLERVV